MGDDVMSQRTFITQRNFDLAVYEVDGFHENIWVIHKEAPAGGPWTSHEYDVMIVNDQIDDVPVCLGTFDGQFEALAKGLEYFDKLNKGYADLAAEAMSPY
jgi:hypothetical protein